MEENETREIFLNERDLENTKNENSDDTKCGFWHLGEKPQRM